MSVEFIGYITNNNSSETIVRSGPVLDLPYIEAVAKAHESAGFDRATSRRLLTIDMDADAALMREGQRRARVDAATRDWAGRAPDELFPPALPFADGAGY